MFFRAVFLAAFLACSLGAVSSAQAQSAVSIAVVDMQAIMSDSLAAKSILEQLKTQRGVLDKEVKQLEGDLKKAEGELVKKKPSLSAEDFVKERKVFEKKLLDSRAKVQKDRAKVDKAFNKALNELRKNLVNVVAELATEKKIGLVITRQNVIVGDKSIEITADVMSRLNDKVKTIKVTVEK